MTSIASSSSKWKSWFRTDAQLHQLYPDSIQVLAQQHWTPLRVAKKAVQYLVSEKGVRVLDIGSGVGKFCLAGAHFTQLAFFYGVEQRKYLVTHAESARNVLEMKNVCFIHGNFTQLDLKEYDHFYFYNSFYENLSFTEKIDESIAYSNELYNYYSHYLHKQLEDMPAGTRIVTYCSWADEIPPGYKLMESHFGNLLKFWMKL